MAKRTRRKLTAEFKREAVKLAGQPGRSMSAVARDPGVERSVGSQHTSEDFQRLLAAEGITCSMSRRGDCWPHVRGSLKGAATLVVATLLKPASDLDVDVAITGTKRIGFRIAEDGGREDRLGEPVEQDQGNHRGPVKVPASMPDRAAGAEGIDLGESGTSMFQRGLRPPEQQLDQGNVGHRILCGATLPDAERLCLRRKRDGPRNRISAQPRRSEE